MNWNGLLRDITLLGAGAILDRVFATGPAAVKAWCAKRRMDAVLGYMYHDPLGHHPATEWTLDTLAKTGFSKRKLLASLEEAERLDLVRQRSSLHWQLTPKGNEYSEGLSMPKAHRETWKTIEGQRKIRRGGH